MVPEGLLRPTPAEELWAHNGYWGMDGQFSLGIGRWWDARFKMDDPTPMYTQAAQN